MISGRRFAAVLAIVFGAAAFAPSRPARAAIVERVVAVIGDRPILLSELRYRARPYLARIAMTAQNPAGAAEQESNTLKDVLQRLVDERLIEQQADKARISVSPEEVDAAIRNVATNAKIPVRDLVQEVRRQGLTEQDYRDEIRRQILEGKMTNLRVRGRVRITPEDARAAYGHLIRELAEQQAVDVRILARRIPPAASEEEVKQSVEFVDGIAAKARAGEDFCKLVELHSEDVQTKQTCGSRGPLPMSALIGPVQEAIKGMKVGDVSDPIRVGAEAILVVQLAHGSAPPPFEQVKEEMAQRAFGEAMERQRRLWLQELRRGVYLDVRF